MASILQTLAEMADIDAGVIDFGAIRMRVGPNDSAAAKFLIGFIDEAVRHKSTYADGELVLLLKLATAINDISIDCLPEDAIEDHDVQVALNSLFWFNFVTALHDIEQPPRLDVRSVWVLRPQPYSGPGPLWKLQGVTVDAKMQPDHKTVLWAICSGENNVMDKNGWWQFSPMPSSRTDEFYQMTRWESMGEAIAFAKAQLNKDLYPNVEL